MQNLTFLGYYGSLKNEKSEFINLISKATNKSSRSVYNWLNSKHPISDEDKIKISKCLNVPIETLFPDTDIPKIL